MLVLSRKIGQSIVIDNRTYTITVCRISGDKVRLGIEAPKGIRVDREEVARRREDNLCNGK
jgi:carbon storage regulator